MPDGGDGMASLSGGVITIRESASAALIGKGPDIEVSHWGWVEAAYYQGRVPQWHRLVSEEGDCRLLEFPDAMCEMGCDGICVGDNDCQPWPVQVNAGAIQIVGLAEAVTLSTYEGNGYRSFYDRGDLFADDALIIATGSGGDVGGFQVRSTGVPEMLPYIDSYVITLEPHVDHVLRWRPSGGDERVQVRINSDNAHHGLPSFAVIECDVPDAVGEVTIPAAMVDAMPELWNWQYISGSDHPRSTIQRYREVRSPTTSAPGEGVLLTVASAVLFGVEHHPDADGGAL
jgi:hypothetical protein